MTEKTLTALKGSIEKWEEVVARAGEDRGSPPCPLCTLFLRNDRCYGCPVMEKTHEHGCYGTPYISFCQDSGRGTKNKEYAKAELKFLKSLLPKKKISRGGK